MTEIAERRWLDKPVGSEKTFREMMQQYEIEYFTGMASAKNCGAYLKGLVEFFGDAGIEDVKPHDLRHTYGTRLSQEGFDIYAIGNLLGHKDIRMTQRYAHHSTQSLRRVVDAFESRVITNLSQSVIGTNLYGV